MEQYGEPSRNRGQNTLPKPIYQPMLKDASAE